MIESDFIKKWENERPMYEAWGKFIRDELQKSVAQTIAPVKLSMFLRLPVEPRLKEEGSLLDKAFYRGKSYSDPYAEITDKVGMRFVVLLTSDLEAIEKSVQESDHWSWSKDKDFHEQQLVQPDVFAYQSVHYVVRANAGIEHLGQKITQGATCEIQIRTILQHAHSELSHDTLYKPTVNASPAMKRAAAKSMALIEATNDYFEEVMRLVLDGTSQSKTLSDNLSNIYLKNIGKEPTRTKSDAIILESLEQLIPNDLEKEMDSFLQRKPHLSKRISDRSNERLLFRLPSILLIYFLADSRPNDLEMHWPLLRNELAPVFTDLGRAFE